ncbi:MAG: mannonate dehydratase [Spirosomataceae bacterium]
MMKNERRVFLKQSAALATAGLVSPEHPFYRRPYQIQHLAKDAGIQLCLAYFWGIEPQKVALAKQMQVLGAVGGISPAMVKMNHDKSHDLKLIRAVKEAWEKEGLQLKVIEGPPSLNTKTKLGLEGRDEEIENFITFLRNIATVGIDTVCYNWMPVISWARTKLDKPSRGGALVSSFDIDDIKNEPSITEYGDLTHARMWDNLTYFLKAVVPEAEKIAGKISLTSRRPTVDISEVFPAS